MHLRIFVDLIDSHCREEANRFFFFLSISRLEQFHERAVSLSSEIQLPEGLEGLASIERAKDL